ncbi:MAG: pentapeptide repeat-containing protein [Candidatus Sumerlaeota bacterium]|nr:pentapeptide repeat-containing protein [Candidatus Sumerlaeota bacterium]
MASAEHFKIFKEAKQHWNDWRKSDPGVRPDLRSADLLLICIDGYNLSGALLQKAAFDHSSLEGVSFQNAELSRSGFQEATVSRCDFRGAKMAKSRFVRAFVQSSDFRHSDIHGADFSDATIWNCNMQDADLLECNLEHAQMVNTNLRRANLTDCKAYGSSTWDVDLDGAVQDSLFITLHGSDGVFIDDLALAQTVNLLMNGGGSSGLLKALSARIVIVFTPMSGERSPLIQTIKQTARERGFFPVVCGFSGRDAGIRQRVLSRLSQVSRRVIIDAVEGQVFVREIQEGFGNCLDARLAVPAPPQDLDQGMSQSQGALALENRIRWMIVVDTTDLGSQLTEFLR